jgi:signal transduction histidine kinase
LRYRQVALAQAKLKDLSARLVDAQEQERRAISRELHDEVGQSLSALLMELGNLGAVAPGDAELRSHVESIRKLAESSVNVVRNMALLLRPSMLDDLGLVPALQWQAREISKRTGLAVTVEAENVADDLPEEHKTCIYRVVQEALNNCARHAFARSVRIVVVQESDRIRLSVLDDGLGFNSTHTRGLGLLGMEERVTHLGGRFHLQSEPGHGARLRIEIPLAASAVEAIA